MKKQPLHAITREQIDDYERDDVETLSWDMQPGDAVIIHPHAASGNAGDHDRIALTSRWFGDDIRWDPRPESVVIPHYPIEKMVAGQAPLIPGAICLC